MANLKLTTKNYLERILQMSGGYVLGFSNRTFQEFVLESTGKNIYSEQYSIRGESKANRLRAFWDVESDFLVGKLLEEIYNCWDEYSDITDPIPPDKILQIALNLKQASPVTDSEWIEPNEDEKTFELLSQQIKQSIENGQPETGLDRLHTFLIKYLRVLCQNHGLQITTNTPLHSLAGSYIKSIKNKGHIESEMTERILRSSISVMEAFNEVRNNQSLAHDNTMLNYSESLLIFNHVASSIRFIKSLEDEIKKTKNDSDSIDF